MVTDAIDAGLKIAAETKDVNVPEVSAPDVSVPEVILPEIKAQSFINRKLLNLDSKETSVRPRACNRSTRVFPHAHASHACWRAIC